MIFARPQRVGGQPSISGTRRGGDEAHLEGVERKGWCAARYSAMIAPLLRSLRGISCGKEPSHVEASADVGGCADSHVEPQSRHRRVIASGVEAELSRKSRWEMLPVEADC
jgi:hypothetical protein